MTPNVERRIDAALLLDVRAELGEGPVWDPAAGCLYFVDILRGRVHRYEPRTGTTLAYTVDRKVGAVALCESGELILAVQGGFMRLDVASGRTTVIADVDADRPDLRMNDGKCDPAGRFWAGTMALDERPGAGGALYRLDPDGRVQMMIGDVTISNGLDWTADGRMYYIDSATQRVDVFDFDLASGAIENRRPFVQIPPEEGIPDGLTLDADGHVWIALWGGGAVHRYAADGRRDAVIRVPTPYPTSCAFGGEDLGDLYITTANVKLTAQERAAQPHAGGVFRARPGVTGRPPNRFKGSR